MNTNQSQPTGSHSKAGSAADSTCETSTGSNAPLEAVQIKQQVASALTAQRDSFEELQREYEKQATELAWQHTQLLYRMISGQDLYTRVAKDLAELMASHPRAPKFSLPDIHLNPIQLQPYSPKPINKVLGQGN